MITTTAQIDILSANRLSLAQAARMFRVEKQGRLVPLSAVLPSVKRTETPVLLPSDRDCILPSITSAAPGSAERIEALREFYAAGGESAFCSE